MLQVNGIDHVYDLDARIQIINVIGRRLITWAHRSAAKKWPSRPPGGTCASWTYPAENGPHRAMADRIFRLDRRELLAGLGAAALGPAVPSIAARPGTPVA